jgi:ATP adenylyltransferase
MNIGKLGGASIDHLHWHIVPRYPGDMNFMEILRTRVLVETLNQSYNKIKKQINILTK